MKRGRPRRTALILMDLVLIVIAFSIIGWIKTGPITSYLERYSISLAIFSAIWVVSSFFFEKYSPEGKDFSPFARKIVFSNTVTLALATWLMYLFLTYNFSRLVVFGTTGIATLFEFIVFGAWFLFKQSHEIADEPYRAKKDSVISDTAIKKETDEPINPARQRAVRQAIINELGEDVYTYFKRNLNLAVESTLIVSTTTKFNIDNQLNNFFKTIVNLKRINDIRWINKFFESVNSKLPKGGIFVCMAETKDLRKKRILNKYPPVINYIFYTFDYILKRVFPKFSLTKGIYFLLTRGENRVLSRAEVLGRIYSCGFEVLDERFIDKHFFVIAVKVKNPAFDLEATYGPLVKLKRIGKGGKIIKVYKMRTMHPYAEYIQDYVYQRHDLQEGGKFKNDFRISTVGRLMRKLWIDELPMIFNFLKGDMKIVGVRPLSKHYFSLYTKEHQERRIKYKPGLVPPFYVDNPKTLEEIQASEQKYFDLYDKRPLWTDIRYFFIAAYNIVFRHYRSG